MPLLTDGRLNEIRDLSEADGTILAVARTEGIDLETKLAQGQREIALELDGFLRTHQEGSGYGLGHVVATDGLKLWHAMHSLRLAYRDAYHSQLNDRYLGRLKEYEKQAAEAKDSYLTAGVGVVDRPIPAAPTPRVVLNNAGSFPGVWTVRVAWTRGAGEEGAWSEAATVNVPEGCSFTVSAGDGPEGATGWNVYASLLEQAPRRQNQEPLAPGASWTLDGIPTSDGAKPSGGQAASRYLKRIRKIQRG